MNEEHRNTRGNTSLSPIGLLLAFCLAGLVLARISSGQPGQPNPAPKQENTNCIVTNITTYCLTAGSVALKPVTGQTNFCLGDTITMSTDTLITTGKVTAVTSYNSCPPATVTNNAPAPQLVTNWWAVSGVGATPGSSSGLSAAFMPTNAGVGTVTFYQRWRNAAPCNTNVQEVNVSTNFTVLEVASLMPSNNVSFTEINLGAPNNRTFVVCAVATNAPITNLMVYAESNPLCDPVNYPPCWSMNGQRTNKVFVGITQPGTNIVICTAGMSGKTNTIIVVKVTEVTLLPLGSVLDGNPKAGGGLRIFPDRTTPTDTIQRNRVLVRARITPPVPGVPIYFKSFDVTDPTPDLTIDPNGPAGDDNLGSPQAGTLISATASTGVSGTAGVEFNVTMQPGDNFRIAAACKAFALALLTVTDPSAPGYIEANGNQVAAFAGRISPMLTVWRKLYYEVDTMDRPTFAQNSWTAEWKNLTPQKVSGSGLGTYTIKLKNIKRNGAVDGYASVDAEFDGGWVRLSMPDTETGYVLARIVSYEASFFLPSTGTATIAILFPFTSSATSGTCDLSDDDLDEGTFMGGVWGSSPFSNLDTSLMIPAYADAYVEPTNNPAWNASGIVFERNTNTDLGGNCYEKIGEKKSINGAPGYRTVTIGYLFQPSYGEDGDPAAGGIVTTGYTPVETIMASPYDKRTAVFAAVTAVDADRGKILGEADTPEKITVVHEVCHTIRGFGHSSTGIMKAVPGAGDTQFAPQDIRAIRQNF